MLWVCLMFIVKISNYIIFYNSLFITYICKVFIQQLYLWQQMQNYGNF